MVVQRQYADKGVGIQKRPPPPPKIKINVDNLIVDDKVKSSENRTRTKKKLGKKSKSSVPLIGVARCEVPGDVLQSREPESSHKRSSGTSSGDRRHPQRNSGGYSPKSSRHKSFPQAPPPKEYAIAPSAKKRTKRLTKTSKPSTNSKTRLFGASSEAKKKAAAAATAAAATSTPSKTDKTTAGSAPSNWNKVLYGKQASPPRPAPPKWNKMLYGKKDTADEAQKNASFGALSESDQSLYTRSIQTELGLDDKITMALDKLMDDFGLDDFFQEKGEQMESMQQHLEEVDKTILPGKAKLLYRRSTETLGSTLEEYKKSANERFEQSIKAMAGTQIGTGTGTGTGSKGEMTDDNEGDVKERNIEQRRAANTSRAFRDVDSRKELFLLGSTFKSDKVAVDYVAANLTHTANMNPREANRLAKKLKRNQGSIAISLGVMSNEKCEEMASALKLRDIDCRALPVAGSSADDNAVKNMDFAKEVTTDTAHNDKSLEVLLKKEPQPQEVSGDGSSNEKGAEATNTVDFSPIKNAIKNKAELAKKSAFKSLNLYLQGLAKGVENLCCSAVDTTTLDEEGTTKPFIEKEMEERNERATFIEKEMEERNERAEISPSVPNVQQQQKEVGQAIVLTSEDVLEAGNDDLEAANTGSNEDIETKSSEDTGIAHQVTPTSNTDADNTGEYSGKSTDEQSKEKYLNGPFQCTFPIDQKVSDLVEIKIKEGDDDEEAIEMSTQKIERKVNELFQFLEERNVSRNDSIGDVVAVVEKSEKEESSNAGKPEGRDEESIGASQNGSVGDAVAVVEKSKESCNAGTTEKDKESAGASQNVVIRIVVDDRREVRFDAETKESADSIGDVVAVVEESEESSNAEKPVERDEESASTRSYRRRLQEYYAVAREGEGPRNGQDR